MSVLCFLRKGADGDPPALAVCNFTPVPRTDYRVGVPRGGFWREMLNTDAAEYGGSGQGNLGGRPAADAAWHGRPYSLQLPLPPLAAIVLVPAAPRGAVSVQLRRPRSPLSPRPPPG